MKKILMLMFCVVMALAVAACGNGSKQAENLSAAKVLKVATDANFPPFEYYQEQSKAHTGFDIDLMNAVAKKLGYEKVEFVNVDFKDIFTGLNEKKYDVAIAGITITPERERIAEFSEPYVEDSYKVVVAKNAQPGDDFPSLEGKTVAAEEGSYALDLLKSKTKTAKIIPVHDTEAGIKLVADGKADALVASRMAASFFIAHNYGAKVRFAGNNVLYADKIGIAVARGNNELEAKINDALKEVRRSGEYKQIYSSYFGK